MLSERRVPFFYSIKPCGIAESRRKMGAHMEGRERMQEPVQAHRIKLQFPAPWGAVEISEDAGKEK